jgi:ABC-type lipoprotein export system ATPase subunit
MAAELDEKKLAVVIGGRTGLGKSLLHNILTMAWNSESGLNDGKSISIQGSARSNIIPETNLFSVDTMGLMDNTGVSENTIVKKSMEHLAGNNLNSIKALIMVFPLDSRQLNVMIDKYNAVKKHIIKRENVKSHIIGLISCATKPTDNMYATSREIILSSFSDIITDDKLLQYCMPVKIGLDEYGDPIMKSVTTEDEFLLLQQQHRCKIFRKKLLEMMSEMVGTVENAGWFYRMFM